MVIVVDYNAGNLTSVRLAFESLGIPAKVTSSPEDVLAAERVVFPGVCAAGAAMENLRQLHLLEPLRRVVSEGTPFLGICIGMQVLFDSSEEDGGVECMGVVPGAVKRFRPDDPLCKIPHMGWNTVQSRREHPVFAGIENGSEFYFVHSYYPSPSDPGMILGETDYAGVRFASVVGKGNLIATQFHPERSGRIGLRVLGNFSSWDGIC